ncbi:MAG TPA: TIGR03943 family protein [Roseiflexaceae bacterium]
MNWAALVEATLLGGAAALLLAKLWNGTLVYYIHPRYTPLIAACAAVLGLLAAVRLWAFVEGPHTALRRMRWRYLLAAVPLLLGTLVPARPLGAGSISGATLDAGIGPAAETLDDDTRQWNLLQWATALSVREDELSGRAADVVGFVYHDPERPLDGFFVVRYVVTCCTADSNGVGLPVVWAGGAALPPDGWVRVRGTLGAAPVGGRAQPALIASAVEAVPQPANPYLYP